MNEYLNSKKRPRILPCQFYSFLSCLLVASPAYTEVTEQARSLARSGQNLSAARLVFSSTDTLQGRDYAFISEQLARMGLYQSGVYFFLRAMETGNSESHRWIAPYLEAYLTRTSSDLLMPLLIKHLKIQDLDSDSRSAFSYVLGKRSLIKGDLATAQTALSAVRESSSLYAFSRHLLSSVLSKRGRLQEALLVAESCEEAAGDLTDFVGQDSGVWVRRSEALDLEQRCIANQARILYEMKDFVEADRRYDRINKKSLVWTETLFEQAWALYSLREHPRALGKLLTYESPLLRFLFLPESYVLRAQAFESLCRFREAEETIQDFERKMFPMAAVMKSFVEKNHGRPEAFFAEGRRVFESDRSKASGMAAVFFSFVDSPVFVGALEQLDAIDRERSTVARLTGSTREGFGGFLSELLNWRRSTVITLGGHFVQNSLMDRHQALLDDMEAMQFVKLEILKGRKQEISGEILDVWDEEREREVVSRRRDDQMYFTFNGEFWIDELGDTVLGVTNRCSQQETSSL